ncbi:hypothetical protein ACHQM5_005962 [Ranunculus cassubicifolius]
MATSHRLYFFLLNFVLLSTIINGQSSTWYSEPDTFTTMEEKVVNLHFYFHDIVSGNKPTAQQIVGSAGGGFGTMMVADDPLTVGQEATSKVIGAAQGVYASASQNDLSLLMVLNYGFTDGKYNGSSLSVLGSNPIMHTVREMPIVGGTGFFRFARGYARAKTVWFNAQGDAIVEYNVTVLMMQGGLVDRDRTTTTTTTTTSTGSSSPGLVPQNKSSASFSSSSNLLFSVFSTILLLYFVFFLY